MIKQFSIILSQSKRGFHLITSQILNQICDLPKVGLMNIFIKHTSAGLTINENFDESVRYDFENSMNKLFPDNSNLYNHTSEGADDMPAHLKSSVIGVSLTIPITNFKLNLGTWQGIYLCEFRNNGGRRNLVVTIYE